MPQAVQIFQHGCPSIVKLCITGSVKAGKEGDPERGYGVEGALIHRHVNRLSRDGQFRSVLR